MPIERDGPYGQELVMDLQGCDPKTFTRDSLSEYFSALCDAIKMDMCEIHFWDDLDVPEEERQTEPHAKGTSAVCFILTSTIVIHTLELTGEVFINIFSCKAFDPKVAKILTEHWFRAGTKLTKHVTLTRGMPQ